MPSNPQNNIIQQLSHLPTMSREQILEFFKQDLSSVEPSKIIGSLKMALLFWDPVEREELKKSILQNLNGLTRKVKELIDYLRLSTYEEMVEEIPIKVKSEKLKVKSEKLKVKSDHFDFDDAMEVDKLREKGTKFTPHSFEDKVQAVINILPSELQKELIADQLLK